MTSVSYEELLDHITDGVYFVDRERRITYWNRGAEALTGFLRREVEGSTCAANILTHVDDQGQRLCTSGCPLAATMIDGQPRTARVFLHHKKGHRVPVVVKSSPIFDPEGNVVGAVELFSDASEQSKLDERLKELERIAMLDQLTEVPNRRYLDLSLNSRHEELRRFGWRYGVLLADVDHFKRFNDTHGHDVGDQVLQMVAKTMATNCRTFDVIGRWGGEEFLAVVAQVNMDQLAVVAERIRMLVATSHLEHEGAQLAVTVSIGAALADQDEPRESVVKRADEMLYQAKRAGRNQICGITGGDARGATQQLMSKSGSKSRPNSSGPSSLQSLRQSSTASAQSPSLHSSTAPISSSTQSTQASNSSASSGLSFS